MKPWGVDGFLNIEAEIEDTHEDIGNGGGDGGAAGGAEDEKDFAVFKNNGRRHGRKRAFSGADGVGWALD